MSHQTLLTTEQEEKLKVLNKTSLDEIDKSFSLNALKVLASRYLLKSEKGEIIESPAQLFERVAVLVGLGDVMHDDMVYSKDEKFIPNLSYSEEFWNNIELAIGKYNLNTYHIEAVVRFYKKEAEHFKISLDTLFSLIARGQFDSYESIITRYEKLMINQEFLPNTPTLMNAGTRIGQLSACFVLDIDDNIESIMDTTKDVALIFKSGGGVGINYSKLRAENSIVASTTGVASGPVSFMSIIDKVTDVIKQGGKRRGANMGILDINHPDVEKFITAKKKPGVLENFNVSVGIDAEFWKRLARGEEKATNLFNLIAESAWASAEPGLIFLDKINENNPLEKARGEPLRATNPCGEQSLYPYESCNLGSINIAKFVENEEFNWERFTSTVEITTRFLDNIVDMNKYPIEKIDKESRATRRIGLGVMGVADALIKLKVGYNSQKGLDFMKDVAESLTFNSMATSVELAKERGSFALYEKSGYKDGLFPVSSLPFEWVYLLHDAKTKGIRNSFCTTVAPTGSLSMIADCSNGIEPSFALAYKKSVAVGEFFYKNKYLEYELEKLGLNTPEIWKRIADNHGSIQRINEIPLDIRNVFVTTFDLNYYAHINAQECWQRFINNAISKTINLPREASVEDVKNAYRIAHEYGLKGITVYRDGSRQTQVLNA